jgi:hypothetical protein
MCMKYSQKTQSDFLDFTIFFLSGVDMYVYEIFSSSSSSYEKNPKRFHHFFFFFKRSRYLYEIFSKKLKAISPFFFFF